MSDNVLLGIIGVDVEGGGFRDPHSAGSRARVESPFPDCREGGLLFKRKRKALWVFFFGRKKRTKVSRLEGEFTISCFCASLLFSYSK